jgi:hypothetical protein
MERPSIHRGLVFSDDHLGPPKVCRARLGSRLLAGGSSPLASPNSSVPRLPRTINGRSSAHLDSPLLRHYRRTVLSAEDARPKPAAFHAAEPVLTGSLLLTGIEVEPSARKHPIKQRF